MPQQRFSLVKCAVIAMLLVSIGISCKKKDAITPLSVITPEFLDFIPIKSGSFMMGSPDGIGDNAEHPQREVTLSAFYLGSTELTQKQFFPFLQSKDANYLVADQRKVNNYITNWVQTDAHPIVNVSWLTAVAYCNWLTKQMNSKDTCYSFTFNGDGTINTVSFDRTKKGYRLPTEAEWEYACRGNTTTKYSFGDNTTNSGDYAWYTTNSSNTTHAVGGKNPNPFGLRDMHGNVWEWCSDLYGNYPTIPETNPTGPATTGSTRVVRGGSYSEAIVSLRSALRNRSNQSSYNEFIGFRLAKTL